MGRINKEVVVAYFKYYPDIRPEGLNTTMKNFKIVTQNSPNIMSGDRFIPLRAGNRWCMKFLMNTEYGQNGLTTKEARENGEGGSERLAFSCLLKNEVLGTNIKDVRGQCDERRVFIPGSNIFSLSPLSAQSQKLLRTAIKATHEISRRPFKVLDAPDLQDDFYLNLIDWSLKPSVLNFFHYPLISTACVTTYSYADKHSCNTYGFNSLRSYFCSRLSIGW